MNAREERGLVIAATQRLVQKGKVWLVPSQSGRGKYTVCPDPERPFCSCPDHEETGGLCKHLYAVEYASKRERKSDGTVVETQTMTFTQKKTYSQNWPAYNLGQTTEKNRFQVLLADLCKGIVDPPQAKTGRKRSPVADMVFMCVFKIYCGMSCRRYGCDLGDAYAKGHISKSYHPMTTCTFLENKMLTPFLERLVAESAAPLRIIETDFAVDSTGFSSCRYDRWTDEKYGCPKQEHAWVKAHICTGVKTHVVAAAKILPKESADAPQFKGLVKATAERFKIGEVSADKAYLSIENVATVYECGGTPYIAFKSNSTGAAGGLFEKMFHHYAANREDYMAHYHKRSNVESTISATKRKFGDSVMSKTDTAMANECLAKIIAENLCCLIQSQCELGIEPVFWQDEPLVKVIEPANIAQTVVPAIEARPVAPMIIEAQPVAAVVPESEPIPAVWSFAVGIGA